MPKDGYFVARSPSYVNILMLRGFLVDGKPDAASKMFREGVKVYPLARAANPPKMQFFNGSKVPYNTIHANNFEFYSELDASTVRSSRGSTRPGGQGRSSWSIERLPLAQARARRPDRIHGVDTRWPPPSC